VVGVKELGGLRQLLTRLQEVTFRLGVGVLQHLVVPVDRVVLPVKVPKFIALCR
jgi:hypothetical protein